MINLTDNPGNWFDTGQTIAGTRSLAVVDARHDAAVQRRQAGGDDRAHGDQPALPDRRELDAVRPGQGVPRHRGRHADAIRASTSSSASCTRSCSAARSSTTRHTPELDLGKTITFMNGATVPTASDLALRFVRAFFNITSPANYQVYSADHATTWDPVYPAVPVRAYDKDGKPGRHPEPRRVPREPLPRAGHASEGHRTDRARASARSGSTRSTRRPHTRPSRGRPPPSTQRPGRSRRSSPFRSSTSTTPTTCGPIATRSSSTTPSGSGTAWPRSTESPARSSRAARSARRRRT